MQFYPPDVWGLDYQFNIYNKMYIKDILEMKEYQMYPGKVKKLCHYFIQNIFENILLWLLAIARKKLRD